MDTEYQESSNSNNDCDERVNETSEASLSLHSSSHTLSEQTPKFILPALRTWRTLPAEPLRLIADFAKHVHDYDKVYPDGLRDNTDACVACVVITCLDKMLIMEPGRHISCTQMTDANTYHGL